MPCLLSAVYWLLRRLGVAKQGLCQVQQIAVARGRALLIGRYMPQQQAAAGWRCCCLGMWDDIAGASVVRTAAAGLLQQRWRLRRHYAGGWTDC
jgi:hypothetical protein